jgi:hypothetical protein
MTKFELSRRALLAAASASGLGTFLPGLRPGSARAAGGAPPKRLLLFWSGSGVPRHIYNFKSAGGGAATETDFVFPEVRAPLNPIKKDLIVLENLDMVSTTVDSTPAGNAHTYAETHCLAATNRANGDTPGGPSIDQYIAKAINGSSPVTKIPSLSLVVQVDGNVSFIKVCTSGPGQVISLNPSPSSVYKRLFPAGSTTPAPAPTAPKPTGPSPEEIAALQRKSVLDLVAGDYDAVKGKLGAAERAKFEAHAAAVRDLEKRLAIGGTAGGGGQAPTVGCADPTSAVLKGTGNAYPGTSAMYQANFDSMTRLVQTAFACDLTRVVMLGIGEPRGSEWGYSSGAWGTTDAHDLIHKTSYNGGGTLKGNADAMKAVTALHQLECKQFIAMLDLLRQVPESDGKTLLDHTIVLWCSQIAEHGHDVDRLPWIVAGGSAAGFKPGRLLSYPRVGNKGAPHNNLFVSIAQAMGVQTNTFGNAKVCTGPLERLRV